MPNGPFGNGGDPGSLCTPVPRGSIVTYALVALENHGTATARITKVNLTDPRHGLRVLAAYVVQVTGTVLYGVRLGFPQADQMPAGEHWQQRVAAEKAQVYGNKVANLVLVLRPAFTGGSARGVDVYYQVGDNQYLLRSATRIRIVVGPSC